ncbi:MAG: hypothetical protein ACRD3N_00995 [Terracidiphilus sp.]
MCSAALAQVSSQAPASSAMQQGVATIPGPLRSFLRMAGISQEIPPNNVLPMLARNVSLWGYENGRETEFLRLVIRYVHMARELRDLTGPDGAIHVTNCSNAQELVHILGYAFQNTCGQKDSYLVTANAGRAFLAVDSGFPLTLLEQDLQAGKPFSYPFPATQVPVLGTEKQWASISARGRRAGEDMLDILLFDSETDRLYSAMARIDPETARELVRAPGLARLLPVADVLDFYGSQISIRSGEVVLPGGADAERGWRELVGASPRSPGEFVSHLLGRDHGWLAAYFDALARVNRDQQVHLTSPARIRRLYDAWRATGTKYGAASGVFPRNADLLLLFTRLEWQPDGEPRVPGDMAMWRDVLYRETRSIGDRDWARGVRGVNTPGQLLDQIVSSANLETDSGPLQLYLALNDIDNGRAPDAKLSQATASLIADKFAKYSQWCTIFGEFPSLDDTSIAQFIQTADRVSGISNQSLRANAMGSFQANVGLWQIFARQGQISPRALNTSWQSTVDPFHNVSSSLTLFQASRNSLQSLVVAAGGSPDVSQDELVDMLAGPLQSTEAGRRAHAEIAARITAVLDNQRLVSLDTLYGLYDGLNSRAHGAQVSDNLLQLAADLREFELPRPIFSGSERTSWSPVVYSSRHAELQVRTDLTRVLRSGAPAAQLEEARGRLAPFLRDTLVGFNYAYYEPPGAQVLRNNPLFVRAHDFTAASVQGVKDVWDAPMPVGVGVTAGGGAFLMGSLADLPFALASMEGDFIAPTHVQALIWKETVPVLLTDAVVPRYWNVSRDELHAVALYQRAGEELLTASASNEQLRGKVTAILAGCTTPRRLAQIEDALVDPGSAAAFVPRFLPVESFYLAAEFRKQFPGQIGRYVNAGSDLEELAQRDPSALSIDRIKKDFGVPHPYMAGSDGPTLLFTGIFPISGGYANRLFGESWESTNLYWARLADEMGDPPPMLNVLIPMLTRHMVANIFGTSIDDWPALLRAMRQTGAEFRAGKFGVESRGLVAER